MASSHGTSGSTGGGGGGGGGPGHPPHGAHVPHAHHTYPAESPEMHDAPDAWHQHTADEGEPQHAHAEVANAGLIIGVGIGLFLLIAFTIGVVYGYYTWFTTKQLNRAEALLDAHGVQMVGLEQEAIDFKKKAAADSEKYSWLTPDSAGTIAAGTVQIPRRRAQERMIETYLKPAP